MSKIKKTSHLSHPPRRARLPSSSTFGMPPPPHSERALLIALPTHRVSSFGAPLEHESSLTVFSLSLLSRFFRPSARCRGEASRAPHRYGPRKYSTYSPFKSTCNATASLSVGSVAARPRNSKDLSPLISSRLVSLLAIRAPSYGSVCHAVTLRLESCACNHYT